MAVSTHESKSRNADIIPAQRIPFVIYACYSGLAKQRTANTGECQFVTDMLQRLSLRIPLLQ